MQQSVARLGNSGDWPSAISRQLSASDSKNLIAEILTDDCLIDIHFEGLHASGTRWKILWRPCDRC
jgi:hypothetical protein